MDLLIEAAAAGIIDLDTIRQQLKMIENEHYLAQHKNKIWCGARGYWYTELPPADGDKRRQIKRKNKEDLENAIIEFYKGLHPAPTFEGAFNDWINHKLEYKEICRGTFDRYNTEFHRFFDKWELKNERVDKLTEDDLERLIRANIAEKKLTAKAYGSMKTILIGIFKHAKKKKFTQISITSFFGDLEISKRSFTRPQQKPQVFSESEIPIILQYLRENPSIENYGLILTFQTGIREGELSGLKFADVTGNRLHIQRQEVKYKGDKGKGVHEIVDYTKTDAGNREIILTESALDTIRAIRRLNPFGEYMMMSGKRKIWTNTFNDRLYKACDACGIPRRSMHKIRKTYGTTLIDANVDDSIIKTQMGHADITTTRKFYYYSNKGEEKRAEQIRRAISY